MPSRLLAALSLLLLSSVAAHATSPGLSDAKAQKAAVKCQKAIDQAGAKLFATELKSLDACSTAVLGCIQVKPTDPACLAKSTAKCAKALRDAIPQAQVSATAKIVKSCGTPLRAADLLATDGLGIGARASACSTDFGLDVCSDLATLAQCVVADQARAAERVFATELPRARELMTHVLSPLPLDDLPAFPGCDLCAEVPSETIGKAVTACGAATSKAGRTFAAAVGKALGGCIDKVFACIQTKPGDAKCLGKAASACDGSVAKLAAARGKLAAGVDKKCGAASALPFATVAGPSGLNLAALADDCAALGVATLASIDDYVACTRRQHECEVAATLRSTLPRTAELVDANVLGGAGALLDAAQCPESLPSHLLTSVARARATRFVGTFSITRFFGGMKKIVGNSGVAATKVAGTAPPSSPSGVRRVSFSQGTPNRFLPGSSKIVKVSYSGAGKSARSMRAAADVVAPIMIVAVKRGDIVVDDHFEIPLDPLAGDEDGEVELELDYSDTPPSCVFDLAIAVSDGDGVSEYTSVEQVADTVPPPTATPAPAVTPTPIATATSFAPTATVTATATTNGVTPTRTATPTATGPTPTPTASPVFAYALTTTTDAVPPGNFAQYILTVTNLTNAPQNARLDYVVPAATTIDGYGPGTGFHQDFTAVAAGASQARFINVKVATGAGTPPDGTLIELVTTDVARGASVARAFEVQSAPPAEIRLATTKGSVVPGGAFTYTIAYRNAAVGAGTGVELSVPVPAGASFANASNGGLLGVDGVVRWAIGDLASGATGEVTLDLTALPSAKAALPIAATLTGEGTPLAHASATTAVYTTPVFAYALTATTSDSAAPGGIVQFLLTVTNLTNAVQNARVSYRVPDFTTVDGYGPGTAFNEDLNNVPAGGSQSRFVNMRIASGVGSPLDGTLIELQVTDGARGASLARTVVVQSAPPAEVRLTTAEGSVAPGGAFAYTIAYHNAALGPRTGLELRVPVPAGATFASATDGGLLGVDGIVRWPIGTVEGNATGEVTLHLTAQPSAKAALQIEATLADAGPAPLARASASTAVYTTPVFAYALTATTSDPVAPGGTVQFVLTVTNLTNATQSATVSYRVPNYTDVGGYGPGTPFNVNFTSVPANGSRSSFVNVDVASGVGSPPDGALIELDATDGARGASVARTVVVQSATPAEVRLTTAQGSVVPGDTFAYAIAYRNAGAAPRTDAELSVPVPTGASFAGATAGGVLGADGIVRWPLGTLAGYAGGEVTLQLTALASAKAALQVEATLGDAGPAPLARASATTAVYAIPVFAYALTATTDPVKPGDTVQLTLTATNLTNAAQTTTVFYRVPNFTKIAGYAPGVVFDQTFSNVPAGGSQSLFINLAVASGVGSPPDGTLIELSATDGARGATVSRTLVVQSAPPAEVRFTTAQSSVAPGDPFAYAIAYHNTSGSPRPDIELRVPVPAGATFASATDGGVLGVDGIVRWPLGTLAGGATGEVTLNLTANATAESALQIEATLGDASPAPLARVSATTAVYAAPVFAYTLTTASDPTSPGANAQLTITATNLTNAVQSATVSYRVPNFTKVAGYSPGTVFNVNFTNVPVGGAPTSVITLAVQNGVGAPPSGTLIDVTVVDGARGMAVSRTIRVQ